MNYLFYYLNLYFWFAIITAIVILIINECKSGYKWKVVIRWPSMILIIITLYSLTFNISSEIDYCIKKRNFEEAHEWLEKMKIQDSLSKESEYKHSLWTFITFDSFIYSITGKSMFGKLFYDEKSYSASEYLVKKYELMDSETSYLLNLGDEESLKRIISVMYNFTFDYSPHIGSFESYNTRQYEYKVNQRCLDEIMRYNRKCDVLLNKAINIKDLDFAKSVIPLYKENLVIEETNFSMFGDNTYKISLSREDISNAQKRLKKAIEEGTFKL